MRDAPGRILIVTSGLGAGGAEQVIAQLVRHWHASGRQVEIATFDGDDDPVYPDLPGDVALHRMATASAPARLLALRRLLVRRRPAIVVSFLTKINLIAALACVGRPVRLICSERNNPERQDAHPAWNLALRLAYHRADVIVCQTEAVRRCFAAPFQRKLATIPNPVPSATSARMASAGNQICAVGRLTRQKGFDLLLDAFARIATRHSEWTLDIWGEGPDRHMLIALSRSLGLEHRVTLRGLSPRARSWTRDADMFVLASRYEGFPNALAEAMAEGLPVVSTNCDFGPADLIDDGRTGLLVESESPVALAAAMERLIADPPMRRQLGAAAHAAMDRFRPDHILRAWDEVLDCRLRPCAATLSARDGAALEIG